MQGGRSFLTALIFIATHGVYLCSYAQPLDSVVHLTKEVIVTAQRFEKEAFTLPQSVASITSKQIELNDLSNAPDVLEAVPGVWMQRTNLGGGSPFVRGLTGYQTLMLIDDIRFNNATFRSGPNQYLNTIDPFLASKIEVVAGAGAVAYGSDAIGGVIHFITKKPAFSEEGLRVDGSLFGKLRSSDMEKSSRLALSLREKNIAFSGGFTISDYGDIRGGRGLGTLSPTGYHTNAFDMKAVVRAGTNAEVTAAYQYFRQNNVPLFHKIVSGDFSTYLFDPQERQMTYLRYERQMKGWIESINLTALYQDSNEQRKTQRAGESIVVEEQDEVSTFGFLLKSKATILSNQKINWYSIAGLDYYNDEVSSVKRETNEVRLLRGLYPDNSKAGQFAVYNSHTVELSNTSISGGIRFNRNVLEIPTEDLSMVEITPSAWVWNLSGTFFIGPHHQVSISSNSAYRAPNINDVSSLGLADFRYEIPNYDLAPEKSLNLELGWKMDDQNLKTSVHVFNNRLNDLIVNERATFNSQDSVNGAQVYQRVNVGKAVIRGAECSTTYDLNKGLSVNGQIIYLYGFAKKEVNEPLRRIPPLNGRLGLHYDMGHWRFQGQWIFADKQQRLSGGDIDDSRIADGGTPAWSVFNLKASYFNEWLLVNVGMENLFNQAYRMHGSGVDGVGRNVWISTKLSF